MVLDSPTSWVRSRTLRHARVNLLPSWPMDDLPWWWLGSIFQCFMQRWNEWKSSGFIWVIILWRNNLMHSCIFTCAHDIAIECICCTDAMHVSTSLTCLWFCTLPSFCVQISHTGFLANFSPRFLRRLLACFSKTVWLALLGATGASTQHPLCVQKQKMSLQNHHPSTLPSRCCHQSDSSEAKFTNLKSTSNHVDRDIDR